MNDLGIISNQFQLLNIISLYDKLNESYPPVLLLYENKLTNKRVTKLANEFGIRIVSKLKTYKYFQYVFIFIFFFIRKNYNRIILGNHESNIFLFCLKMIKFQKLIVVDDGNILDFKDTKPRISNAFLPLDFYSIFKLNSNKNFNFIINNYETLKSKENKKVDNRVVFLGQPFVELGLISEHLYANILERILFNYDIEYYIHPREKIKSIANFKIIHTNICVEIDFLKSNSIPKTIIGFYSTSLITLPLMFKNINVYYLDISKYSSINLGQKSYEYFKQSRIISELHC